MSIQLKGNDESSFSDDVVIGSGKITLSGADGTATFGGRVDIGNNIDNASGVRIYTDGSVYTRFDTTDSGSAVWKSYNGGFGDADLKSAIYTNGAASFKGAIEVDRTEGTNTGVIIRENGTARTRLYASGSAEFASSVEATGGVYGSRSNDNDYAFVGRVTGSINSLQITAGGTIYAAGTTIQPISSERRLKENIVPIDSDTAWETIKSTPYYAYNFIGNSASSYGPMADEVPAEMVVQTIEENEAGVMVARSDDEGPIRTFDNGMLQARLYTALQAALTRIEALEAEVQSFKGGQS